MKMFLTKGTLSISHGLMILGWGIGGTLCITYRFGEWAVFCFVSLIVQAFFGTMIISFVETRDLQRWVNHLESTWKSRPIKSKPSIDDILKSGKDIENRL